MSVEIPRSFALDATASAIRRLRHPIEEFRQVNEQLAAEFETISRRLEFLALSAGNSPVTVADPANNPQVITGDRVIPKTRFPLSQTFKTYDAKIREQRKLSDQWNALMENIRLIDRFSHFLKSVPFATLRIAAADGPVVVVNISEYRSDAIIIRESVDPIRVPLPKAAQKILSNLYTRFRETRRRFLFNKHLSDELSADLGKLWKIFVEPLVDELNKIGVEKSSRIWWCATSYLCGIPFNAAGPFIPYEKDHFVSDHMWLPDFYVSSYTSTLSALASATSKLVSGINAPSLLLAAQPRSLTYVTEEISRIKKSDRIIETMVGVLERLPDHPFVHFACHCFNPDSFHSSLVL